MKVTNIGQWISENMTSDDIKFDFLSFLKQFTKPRLPHLISPSSHCNLNKLGNGSYEASPSYLAG
jgi:hypothetical protein